VYDAPPSADEDVPCPLCYYNLRGQVEPRCPECGYRFEWRDLRDPSRRRHPYLFEHHPRRNVWSLWRTFVGALRPRRFWRTLRPEQPSDVRRLVTYCFLANLFALALPFAIVGLDMAEHAVSNQRYRSYNRPRLTAAQQAFLDRNHPLPPSSAFFSQYFSRMDGDVFGAALAVAAIYSAWPWLTFLALNVFGISMLRAKVESSHVLRCVAYTFDGVSLLGWVLLLGAGAAMVGAELIASPGRELGIDDEAIGVTIVLWAVAALALFVYRLSIAYRLYLQFHRPLLTTLASQIIVALFVLTAVLWILVVA
jgi:hypothetical protein